MRVCKNCGKDISDTHFNRVFCSNQCKEKDRYKRFGQRTTTATRKIYYAGRISKPGYKEKIHAQEQARYYKTQEFIREYKVSVGCKDCGYNEHHAALEFDHISDNKEINVCNAKSIARAKKEIKKCEVVCSNCHKIRTYNRMQDKKLL